MGRFVVTGCAGFIGSQLTEALLARGDEVVGLDSFSDYYPRDAKEANLAVARADDRFRLLEGDVVAADLTELLPGSDGIFHLAAQPGVRGSWGQTFEIYVHDNVLATQHVLEAAASAGTRVVFASSSSVYGNAETYPTREETPSRPVSPYGVTKLTCEQLALAYRDNFGLDFAGLRYFTVYGPRQRPDMAFAKITRALLEDGTFTLFGTGEQTRDVTFVGDAVSATLAAMDTRAASGFFNVGGGSETSLAAAIATLEELSGRRLQVEHAPPAPGDVRRTGADVTRARDELGWTPRVSIPEGLALQLDFAQSRPAA